jgi:hypothetical protein
MAVSIKDMQEISLDVYMGCISLIKVDPTGEISIISTRELPVSYTVYSSRC